MSHPNPAERRSPHREVASQVDWAGKVRRARSAYLDGELPISALVRIYSRPVVEEALASVPKELRRQAHKL